MKRADSLIGWPVRASFYFICFSIRSGSSLLCEDLEQWGLGRPREYFQFPNPELAGRNLGDYLVELAEEAQGECFGFKISWDQAWELTLHLRRQIWIIAGIVAAALAAIGISGRRTRLLEPSAVLGTTDRQDDTSVQASG